MAGVFAEVLGWRGSVWMTISSSWVVIRLIATQVVARLGAALDTRVPVRALFEAPTVAALAARVRVACWWRWRGRRWLARSRPERVPLSLAQQRMWFLNRFDPESAAVQHSDRAAAVR